MKEFIMNNRTGLFCVLALIAVFGLTAVLGAVIL